MGIEQGKGSVHGVKRPHAERQNILDFNSLSASFWKQQPFKGVWWESLYEIMHASYLVHLLNIICMLCDDNKNVDDDLDPLST